MQESTLFKVASITTILGLLVLFWYGQQSDGEWLKKIDLPSEEKMAMEGVVTKIAKADKVFFITIDGFRKETSQVIVFSKDELELQEGDKIKVSGAVEEYKGKKEIIATKIDLISSRDG